MMMSVYDLIKLFRMILKFQEQNGEVSYYDTVNHTIRTKSGKYFLMLEEFKGV